jgi:hypothetical protein
VERLATEPLAISDSMHWVGADLERNHDVWPLCEAPWSRPEPASSTSPRASSAACSGITGSIRQERCSSTTSPPIVRGAKEVSMHARLGTGAAGAERDLHESRARFAPAVP